jgi:hypothetical protein
MERLMAKQDDEERLEIAQKVAAATARRVGEPGDREYLIVYYMMLIKMYPRRQRTYQVCLANAQQMSV